jgi:dTDP-glucose pyrophosphorylase
MIDAELQALFIPPTHSIRQAIACIDRGGQGIAIVVDEERRLLGTISDGDVRRAMLASVDLDTPVGALLARKAESPYPRPVTAPVGTPREALLQLMQERVLRQIPLLDEDGRVRDLALLNDLLPTQDVPLQAVIMAGGFGTRLRPLTEELPKPMLPVGDRPLMERIIVQLREAGIRQVNVTTHHQRERIIRYFGDGRAFGVEMTYVNEDRPLGTAGALGLMPAPQGPLLVINGDILTQVDFRAMVAFHQEQRADMTVGVRQYSLQVPYGVIECDGPYVRRLTEKPQLRLFVNAGIYLLEPAVHQYIRSDQHFDMTDLIQRLLDAQQSVVSFPIHEYWLDIGQHPDYVRAQEDVENGRIAP